MKNKARLYTTEEIDKELNFTPEEWARIDAHAQYLTTLYELRATRKKLGMTQEELSRRSGVSRPLLSKIESGRRNVTIQTLMKLAHAMNMKVEVKFS